MHIHAVEIVPVTDFCIVCRCHSMVRSRVNCTLGHVGVHTRPWSWLVFWKSIHDLCKEAKTPIIKLSQLQTLNFWKDIENRGVSNYYVNIKILSPSMCHLTSSLKFQVCYSIKEKCWLYHYSQATCIAGIPPS